MYVDIESEQQLRDRTAKGPCSFKWYVDRNRKHFEIISSGVKTEANLEV